MGCGPSSNLVGHGNGGAATGKDPPAQNRYAVAREGEDVPDSTATPGGGEQKEGNGDLTNIGDFNVERGGRKGRRRSRGADDDEDMDDAMRRLKEKVRRESQRRKRRKGGNSGRKAVEDQMRASQRNIIMNEIKSETPFSASAREDDAGLEGGSKYLGGQHGGSLQANDSGAHLQAAEVSGLPGLRLKQF